MASQPVDIVKRKGKGRPTKLQKLAENHPRALKHLGDNDIIRPMRADMLEKFKAVIKAYKEEGNVAKACAKADVKEPTFYLWMRKYSEAKELAKKVGLGIKGDPSVRVINAKPPSAKEDDSAFTIFDLPTRKEWNTEQRQAAIKKTMDALKVGVPFGFAVRYAGIDKKRLTQWVTEEPGLLDVLLQAEAEWSVTFFRCLTKAAVVAADKGKFLEIVQGAERRFASQWGQVQAIDLTLKKEDGTQSIVSIDKNTMDAAFEKELQDEIKEEKKWER